jgi:uncharacterized membrane protein
VVKSHQPGETGGVKANPWLQAILFVKQFQLLNIFGFVMGSLLAYQTAKIKFQTLLCSKPQVYERIYDE